MYNNRRYKVHIGFLDELMRAGTREICGRLISRLTTYMFVPRQRGPPGGAVVRYPRPHHQLLHVFAPHIRRCRRPPGRPCPPLSPSTGPLASVAAAVHRPAVSSTMVIFTVLVCRLHRLRPPPPSSTAMTTIIVDYCVLLSSSSLSSVLVVCGHWTTALVLVSALVDRVRLGHGPRPPRPYRRSHRPRCEPRPQQPPPLPLASAMATALVHHGHRRHVLLPQIIHYTRCIRPPQPLSFTRGHHRRRRPLLPPRRSSSTLATVLVHGHRR